MRLNFDIFSNVPAAGRPRSITLMAPTLAGGGDKGLTLVFGAFLENGAVVIDVSNVNVVNERFPLNANHQLGQLRCGLRVAKYCQLTFKEWKGRYAYRCNDINRRFR